MLVRASIVLCSGLMFSALPGQPADEAPGPAVEIAEVRFGSVRDGAGEAWWQAEVEVRVGTGGGGRERFVSRVRVDFAFAVAVDGVEGGFEFFRSGATAAALAGGRWMFRFHLPPTITLRDRVQGAPAHWVADLAVAGVPQPVTRRRVGPGFTSPAALDNFRAQLARRAERNDGVLLPEHLSAFSEPRDGAAPVMVRPEAVARMP